MTTDEEIWKKEGYDKSNQVFLSAKNNVLDLMKKAREDERQKKLNDKVGVFCSLCKTPTRIISFDSGCIYCGYTSFIIQFPDEKKEKEAEK